MDLNSKTLIILEIFVIVLLFLLIREYFYNPNKNNCKNIEKFENETIEEEENINTLSESKIRLFSIINQYGELLLEKNLSSNRIIRINNQSETNLNISKIKSLSIEDNQNKLFLIKFIFKINNTSDNNIIEIVSNQYDVDDINNILENNYNLIDDSIKLDEIVVYPNNLYIDELKKESVNDEKIFYFSENNYLGLKKNIDINNTRINFNVGHNIKSVIIPNFSDKSILTKKNVVYKTTKLKLYYLNDTSQQEEYFEIFNSINSIIIEQNINNIFLGYEINIGDSYIDTLGAIKVLDFNKNQLNNLKLKLNELINDRYNKQNQILENETKFKEQMIERLMKNIEKKNKKIYTNIFNMNI